MKKKVEKIVTQWLKLQKIRVSEEYIKNELSAHPFYPSALSITDTLNKLNIQSTAMLIEKENVSKIPTPFLAHVNKKGGEFVLVSDLEKKSNIREFLNHWSGVVIFLISYGNLNNQENEKFLNIEKKTFQKTRRWLVFFLTSLIAILLSEFRWSISLLLLLSLAGLFFSIIVSRLEYGIQNQITDYLCNVENEVSCTTMMNTFSKNNLSIFNLSKLSVSWFFSYSLALIISLLSNSSSGFLNTIAMCSFIPLPIILYSLYYQKFIERKWCPICLSIILTLLLMMCTVILFHLPLPLANPSIKSLTTLGLLLSVSFFLWNDVLTPIFDNNLELIEQNSILSRFKNNPDIFSSLLLKQPKVSANTSNNVLQLGDSNSPVQVTVAYNPYCNPCAEAHKILSNIVERNQIGLSIRFTSNMYKNQDKKTETVKYLYQLLSNCSKNQKIEIVNSWYSNMNLQTFKDMYPLKNKLEVDSLVMEDYNWCQLNKITYTPTIFINGNRLPPQYSVRDLPFQIGNLKWKSI